jgi:DHA1 family multidrug resistance protein-like MFS transporter
MEFIKTHTTGLEPWQRTLYIMFIAQLMVAVGFSSIFPFLPLYVEQLGSTTGLNIEILAGLVYSGQAFAMMFSAPIWGTLADRYGRKLMVERSMFGGAVILLMMAFVTSAEQLVALRVLQGLVTGTIAAANALVASITPRKQIGYAMGMLQVGFGAGIAVGPMVGGTIADAYGYRPAFYITAVMLFLAGILVWLGVKENFAPVKITTERSPGLVKQWGQIIGTRGVKATFGLRFLSSMARMVIMPIVPLFVLELMPDTHSVNTFTGFLMGLNSAATTVSAIYLGRLGDRIGHRRVITVSLFACTLLYLPQGLVAEGWHLLIFQVLVGVALGGIIPTISALLAQFIRSGEEGSAYGLDNSINAGGRSIAPLLGGAVAVWFGMRATFTVTGVLFLLTTIMALLFLPQTEINPIGDTA